MYIVQQLNISSNFEYLKKTLILINFKNNNLIYC